MPKEILSKSEYEVNLREVEKLYDALCKVEKKVDNVFSGAYWLWVNIDTNLHEKRKKLKVEKDFYELDLNYCKLKFLVKSLKELSLKIYEALSTIREVRKQLQNALDEVYK